MSFFNITEIMNCNILYCGIIGLLVLTLLMLIKNPSTLYLVIIYSHFLCSILVVSELNTSELRIIKKFANHILLLILVFIEQLTLLIFEKGKHILAVSIILILVFSIKTILGLYYNSIKQKQSNTF